jgi:hypothetical protein
MVREGSLSVYMRGGHATHLADFRVFPPCLAGKGLQQAHSSKKVIAGDVNTPGVQ